MTVPHLPPKNVQVVQANAGRAGVAAPVSPVDKLDREYTPSVSGGNSGQPGLPTGYANGAGTALASSACPAAEEFTEPLTPLPPVRLAIPSDPRCLRMVRDVVCRFSQLLGFAEETRFQLQLAVDEALTNVIRHCYHDQNDCPIEVTLEAADLRARPALRVEIRDFGQQADPAAFRGRDLDDPRPGGLGMHIIRSVMDEVSYDPVRSGGMRLRMIKLVPLPAPHSSANPL